MSVRCPACRADNTADTCRRCKADLTPLTRLIAARGRHIISATQALAGGAFDSSGEEIAAAERLFPDAETRRLRALWCLLRRDFAGAWAAARHLG